MSRHNEHEEILLAAILRVEKRIEEDVERSTAAEQFSAFILKEMLDELKAIYRLGQVQARFLEQIITLLTPPHLTRILIAFQGASMATPVAGPITLTTAGQQVTASVLGFDQFGNPFTGPLPVAVLSSDDTAGAIVTFDPSTGLTTAVANGVANITATLTTAEGTVLTDTEAVTVAISVTPPPTPVLSSIKIAFA